LTLAQAEKGATYVLYITVGNDFFTRKQYPLTAPIAIKDEGDKTVEIIVQQSLGQDKKKIG